MAAEYQVPRILWESLESVLLAQGRSFVKDCAKRLDINEKELLRRVMPVSKINVYLHDTTSDSLQCKAYIHMGAITHHCRRPVALGAEFCVQHRRDRLIIDPPSEDQHVQKLQDDSERPTLWAKTDGTVINSYGNSIGTYDNSTGKLRIYTIDM